MSFVTTRVAGAAALALPLTLLIPTIEAPAAHAETGTADRVHKRSTDVPDVAPQPAAPGAPAAPDSLQVPAEPADVSTPAKDGSTSATKTTGFADVTWGPSRWEGRKLRHPRGGRFYPQVLRWANLVAAVMREKNIPKRYLNGILAQLQQESSGNPYSVNRWDSNAAAGYPSKGLLQVIAPTYRAYAKPGFKSLHYQTVPYTNVWAALEYVIHRYGMSKFRKWNHGYNQGY